MERENLLGIDWGEVKVGVALAHAETGLALAYATYANDEELIGKIEEIVESEGVGTIVIGIPRHEKREENTFPQEVFGNQLKERLHLEVKFHDEMFTTKMAQAALIAQGQKKVSAQDDAESARILLQSYLDQR